MNARECVFRAHIYIYVSIYIYVYKFIYICICVFTCTHFCVPTRHVFVFQENTCLLSDEYSCVCLCFCVRINVCVHLCSTRVCSLVHMCVFTRADMCVLIGHVFAFQENTRLLSDGHAGVCVCVSGEHTVVIGWARWCVCAPGVHL